MRVPSHLKPWLAYLARQRRFGTAVVGGGAILLAAGGITLAFRMATQRTQAMYMAELRADLATLQEAYTFARESADSSSDSQVNRFHAAFPEEAGPEPALAEFVETLQANGISSYRYSLLANDSGSLDDRALTEDPTSGSDDADGSRAPESGRENDLDSRDDGVASGGLSSYRELRRWPIDVWFRASYQEALALVRALQESPRLWRADDLELTRDENGLQARLHLDAYSRQPSSAFGPDGLPSGRAAAPLPAVPTLGAVRVGSRNRAAWLNGKRRVEGETVGGWTVEEIGSQGVVLRDAYGRTVRVPVK